MPRQPRIVIPDQPLHIMHRGNNRQDVFLSFEDHHRFLGNLAVSLKKRMFLARLCVDDKPFSSIAQSTS